MTGLWILLGVVIALAGWAVVVYNRLIARRNRVDEAWSGIDVELQRRADVVPNLVSTVRGYADHEEGVLSQVTQARAQLLAARDPDEAARADDQLEAALGRLFAVAESYPDLKASANFGQLQQELSRLEEEISFSRRFYNAVVEEHNTGIQRLPAVLLARPLGFGERQYFRAGLDDRARPDVKF